MSSAVSALPGAQSHGAIAVHESGLRGMITLRGTFGDATFQAAIKQVFDLEIPGQRRAVTNATCRLIWMSKDELLAVVDYDAAPALAMAVSTALAGQHHMAQVVSDARAVFALAGHGAREVLAKGAPVDLSPAAFGQGDVRRSRLGQVAVAFWMTNDDTFELVCFRSVAAFVFDWLTVSAKPNSLPEYF